MNGDAAKSDSVEDFLNTDDGSPTTSNSKRGIFVRNCIIGGFCGAVALTVPFVLPVLRRRGAPFHITNTARLQRLLDTLMGGGTKPHNTTPLLRVDRGTTTFIDVGCGDGRLVMEAAKRGMNGYGYDNNYWLIGVSWVRALRTPSVLPRVSFRAADMWRQDISHGDVVMIYGVNYIMDRMGTKFEKELAPGTLVISSRFPVNREGWSSRLLLHQDEFYVYRMGEKVDAAAERVESTID